MKSLRVVVLGLVSLSLLLGPVSVRPVEAHTGYWRNTGNGINLREGPGAEYAVIGSVPSWGVVKAFGHRGNWLKLRVLSTGQVGWAWLWNFHESSYVPPLPATGSTGGESGNIQTCFWNYWGRTVCGAQWVMEAIYNAARRWGVGYWWLASVAACESDLLPYAYNGGGPVYGLFQFRWGTYYGYGGWGDIYNVYGQAEVAAKMFAQGLAWHWHCAQLLGYA